MNKLGLIACVYLLSVLLISCNGCNQAAPSDVNTLWKSENSPKERTVDSFNDIRYEKPVKEEPVNNSTSRSTSGTASYSSSTRNGDHDNMRGFDPASEDDMDDNGMSRYMENDDDSGWD